MVSETLADTEEIVHEPTQAAVEPTNVWAFMQAHGIKDYDAVQGNSGAHGAPDSKSGETASQGGPQFTDWYSGGSISVAYNVLDRHAARDNGRRNTVTCLWEGEAVGRGTSRTTNSTASRTRWQTPSGNGA